MRHLSIVSVVIVGCLGCGAGAEPGDSTAPPEAEVIEEGVDSPLSVQVVAATGQPVLDAEAVVISGFYAPIEGTSEAPLRVDGEGRIALLLTAEQRQDALLLIWAPGHASLRFEIDPTSDSQVARLPEATALRGRLEASTRVEQVWLQTTDPEAAWPFFVRCDVDEDNRFVVLGLAEGPYRVSSRPIGGAPVLGSDHAGRVAYVAEDPGPVAALDFRLVDREIVADGREQVLRVAFGQTMVVGEVVDEVGAAIQGAQLQFSSEGPGRTAAQTDENGRFEAAVRPSPNLRIAASHPDYGHQWTDYEWRGWSQYDEIPDTPVRLVLRRGVVLTGRLIDESGAPRPNFPLLMIPAYVGSGPATLEARTDAQGRFSFERAVLNHFEVVPRSLDEWHPDSRGQPGEHLRIDDDRAGWLAQSSANRPIELRLESYTLVPVTIRLEDASGAVLRNRQFGIWTRSAPDQYLSQVPRTDTDGRVRVLMEQGVRYELWANPFDPERSREAPWTQGIEAQWTGTTDRAMQLTLVPIDPS